MNTRRIRPARKGKKRNVKKNASVTSSALSNANSPTLTMSTDGNSVLAWLSVNDSDKKN